MPARTYYVYILASRRRTIYTGDTANLARRLEQHLAESGSVFVAKYNVHRLVYVERASSRMEAVEREKQIKRWRREKKVVLIERINPTWADLTFHPGAW